MSRMKSKDTPLAELTLRKYERPYKLKGRDLATKICLSLGLLQPGDSRDVVVDVFYALLLHEKLTAIQIEDEVIALRKKHKLAMQGIAASNLRRQLRRLRELFLVEKIGTEYRINERETLSNIYKEKIEQFLLRSITERLSEYFAAADNEFFGKTADARPGKKAEQKE